MSHRCEAIGCSAPTADDQLMCLKHWRLVPKPLASKVWETWKQRVASGNPRLHEAAKKAAIEAVARAEGRPL